MPNSYRPSGLGGIAGSGIYSRPTSPDYSSAIDSLSAALRGGADTVEVEIADEPTGLVISIGHKVDCWDASSDALLEDRVSAFGGSLRHHSSCGHARLVAELPCA